MKGDFTRLPFNPKKQFRKVYMQQGRVQLDSDWNNQIDILSHLNETQLRDLIGVSGAPRDHAGFRLRARNELLFDGRSSYLNIDTFQGFSFDGSRPFTIEAWVNPMNGHNLGGVIINRYQHASVDDPQQGECYLAVTPDGFLEFVYTEYIKTDAGTVKIATMRLVSDEAVTFGAFSHLAVSFDGRTNRLFINGRQVGEKNRNSRGPQAASAPLLFGAAFIDRKITRNFYGVMGEIRLWSTSLNAKQIQHLMYRKLTGRERDLLGYWPFNEGATTNKKEARVWDKGPHELHGSLSRDDAPQWAPLRIKIGAGRYYVNGILCENETDIYSHEQPDYPDAVPPEDVENNGPYLAYLDVWERALSSVEDSGLAEVALEGADTTVAVKNVWQLKFLPIQPIQNHAPEEIPEWRSFLSKRRQKGRLRAFHRASSQSVGNQLYRVEIHCNGALKGSERPSFDEEGTISIESPQKKTALRNEQPAKLTAIDATRDGEPWFIGQLVELYSQLDPKRAVLTSVINNNNNVLTLGYVPPEMENRDKPCIRKIAGMKWSSDNAAQLWSVASINPNNRTLTLADNGRDTSLLQDGGWVELISERSVYHNQPGLLIQLSTTSNPRHFTTSQDLPGQNELGAEPIVRLWSQRRGSGDFENGLIPVVAETEEISLEKGIRVQFQADGVYQRGDYWIFPSRTLLEAGVEWPGDGNAQPIMQEPHGIHHHYCPIAVVESVDHQLQITDLRRFFSPLLHLSGQHSDGGPPAGTPPPGLPDATVSLAEMPMEDAGRIPQGHAILGRTPVPPLGFEFTGLSIQADPWCEVAILPNTMEPDAGFAGAVSLGDRVLVILDTGSVWLFDPEKEQDAWTQCAPIHTPRRKFGICVNDYKVYVIGGLDANGKVSAANEAYNLLQDHWEIHPDLPTPRSGLELVSVGEYIYAVGGEQKKRLGFIPNISNKNEVFHVSTGEWGHCAPMRTARSDFGLCVLEDRIFAFAGRCPRFFGLFGETATHLNEVYNIETDGWFPGTPQSKARLGIGVAAVDGKIYTMGGQTKAGERLVTCEQFDPDTNQWYLKENLPIAISGMTLSVIADKILLLGGSTEYGRRKQIMEFATRSKLYAHLKR